MCDTDHRYDGRSPATSTGTDAVHGRRVYLLKVFWEVYADYTMAPELGQKEKAVQAATLKTVMGKECRQILGRMELSREEMNDKEIILTKLEYYFEPT